MSQGTPIRTNEDSRVPVASPRASVACEGDESCTVLVVDDEVAVRRLAKRALERSGLTVIEARNGLEATKLYAAHGREIDVVLLDLSMPEMGGAETLAELLKVDEDARVVLSSGYDEEDATESIAPGALAGFIQKPYTPKALVDMIRGARRR